MDKVAEQKVYNETFVELVKAGQIKEAAASSQSFTRNRLREESFTEHILTPIDISNDELDKSEDAELLVKWNEREPDTAPAMVVPFGVVPDGLQFKGSRYPSYFSRLMTPAFMKDIDKLRGYDYDIRSVMLENSTKDLAAVLDSSFITRINSGLGTINTTNKAISGYDFPQYVSIAGGITRDNMISGFNVMQRLKVPFGPMQPDGKSSKGIMLMNNITGQEFLKFQRSEVGGDESQRAYLEGTPPKSVLGVNSVYTIKSDIVPDGTIYLFSAEEFLGKYLRLQPLTVFMKNEAFFLMWFQYMCISISIGNVRGAVRLDFV